MTISLYRPTDDAVSAFRARQERAAVSYPEVGATRGELPGGYHVDRSDVVVGRGADDFARMSTGLRAWKQFAGQGGRIRVAPPAPPFEVGATVVLVGCHFGIHTLSACRVVYIVDEPRKLAFAYGTLEHAVRGEELFELERCPDDHVRFRLVAFSVPAELVVRLGTPVARHFQKQAGQSYARGLMEFRR